MDVEIGEVVGFLLMVFGEGGEGFIDVVFEDDVLELVDDGVIVLVID